MQYLTSMQMAEKWGLTKRRVNALCQNGSIEGAFNDGFRWRIPADTPRPESRKYKKKIVKMGRNRFPLAYRIIRWLCPAITM